MSENQTWKPIGKVKDAHGLKGELYILIFSGEAAWAKKLKQCRLGGKIFDIERAKPFKQGLIIKPQTINDRNQSEALKGLEFSIPENLLVSQKGETIYLSEIMGFEVFDQVKSIGKVIGTSMNGGHDLLLVEMPFGKNQFVTVEIPFVESYIDQLQWEQKRIVMRLPEGLIDIQVQASGDGPEDDES